jgi:acetyltransferase-like isoleucine patch superfamily enzyme
VFSFYLRHISLLRKSGIFLPFVIGNPARIKIQKGGRIELKSRLRIGNNKLPLLSTVKTNIFISENAILKIEDSVSIGPGVNIILKENSHLEIGANTYFTSDSHIEAVSKIKIGRDCAISWGVSIIDSNHHTLLDEKKEKEPTAEVIIEDHVWIGCNSIILKGSKIGSNSVIAAGSIVKGDFPSNSLIAGNPAKIVKVDINWK